jgi:hypothetical protein
VMTVRRVSDDGTGDPLVWCNWFEGDRLSSGGFPPSSLDHVSKRRGTPRPSH